MIRQVRQAARRPGLGPVQVRRALKDVASELGKRGHLARMASTTPAQRRAIALRGAEARWQGKRS
jgi:hypothetical protein